MSSSNCCFLTCIQVSQEAGQMVWYPISFKNFPQFAVIQVKGFGVVIEAEVNIFLGLSCFCDDPVHVVNLISGSSRFTYCWSLAWRILNVCRVNLFHGNRIVVCRGQGVECPNSLLYRPLTIPPGFYQSSPLPLGMFELSVSKSFPQFLDIMFPPFSGWNVSFSFLCSESFSFLSAFFALQFICF